MKHFIICLFLQGAAILSLVYSWQKEQGLSRRAQVLSQGIQKNSVEIPKITLSPLPIAGPSAFTALFDTPLLAWDAQKLVFLDPDAPMLDGISPLWKKVHGFALNESDLWNADPDSDGANNLDEYRAQTDPLDSNSTPPFIARIKLQSSETVHIPIQFKGYLLNGKVPGPFQVEVQGANRWVKMDQSISLSQSFPWTPVAFEVQKNSVLKSSLQSFVSEDQSILCLMREDGVCIELTRNTPTSIEEQTAHFVFWDKQKRLHKISAQRGAFFAFAGATYRLQEITPTYAVIQSKDGTIALKIPHATPLEEKWLTSCEDDVSQMFAAAK